MTIIWRTLGMLMLVAALFGSMAASKANDGSPSLTQPEQGAPAPGPQENVNPQKPADGTPATIIDAQQIESVLGKNVRSASEENIGRIVDVLVNRSGQIRAAVIDFGGFLGVGSRKIAVNWSALHFDTQSKSGDIIVNLTRDRLRVAPEYKPGEPVVILDADNVSPDAKGAPEK